MYGRAVVYVTAAISRGTLRPHIPSAAQIRRGACSGTIAPAVRSLPGRWSDLFGVIARRTPFHAGS